NLRKIFLLGSFSGKINNGQQANTTLSSERSCERGRASNIFADERSTRLVQSESAILFRNVRADQAKLGSFVDQLASQLPVVLLEFIDPGIDLVIDKLPSGVGDHAVLFSKIFRSEDFFR